MKNPFRTLIAEWRNWPAQTFCEMVTLVLVGLLIGAAFLVVL